MKKENQSKIKKMQTDKITTYFKAEKLPLFIVTVSGIIYNVGMVAGPWFEGQLVQCLIEVMKRKKTYSTMVFLAIMYILTISGVQLSRFIKRLYVRKFANNVNRDMKQVLYGNIVRKRKSELQKDGLGNIMTKAIADVDTCAEGMRKFTTEIFDTGVVMAAYIVMLLIYDWKLTLLCMIFPPIAYVTAEKLKLIVSKSASAYKKSAGKLNEYTMDRVNNAITYRIYGQEKHIDECYEKVLSEYESKAALASIWETAMQPIYQIVSTLSVIFILWMGTRNVLGNGFAQWNVAAFTTYLSCFMKLAVKSSKAAKLFNAVQKARVSWDRVKPYMAAYENKERCLSDEINQGMVLSATDLSFKYENTENYILENVNFIVKTNEILGVTGPVACGKSTLGKVLLGEDTYEGSIKINNIELKNMPGKELVGYMGHESELLSASIEDNILLGEKGDAMPLLRAVCMEKEIEQMPDGVKTMIGNGGMKLSGGQQARIAFARTLYHRKKIMIFDDPFSAVDLQTEKQIFNNIRPVIKDSIVIIISHRLSQFESFDKIVWLGKKTMTETHKAMMQQNVEYAMLYKLQMGDKGEK